MYFPKSEAIFVLLIILKTPSIQGKPKVSSSLPIVDVMKTYPRFSSQTLVNLISLAILLAVLFSLSTVNAQNISFANYKLISGAAGQKGAMYRFSAVTKDLSGKPAADCIVKIESMSPGVNLKQLNHDAAGNISSFQPEVEYSNINGPSWIEFSFTFVNHNTAAQVSLHNLSEITTSVSGLNNYGNAQEYAECNLGPNSKVVYETEITNLAITATGSGYRAENKFGSAKKDKNAEKLSIINKNVSVVKIKIGINRNNNNWAGTSTYKIELKDANPDMTTVYMPDIVGFQARMQQDRIQLDWSSPNQDNIQDIVVEKSVDGEIFREVGHFRKTDMEKDGLYQFNDDARSASTMGAVFYRLRTRSMKGDIQYSSVKMVALNKKEAFVKTDITIDPATGASVLLTPISWQQKAVFAEVFNAQGDLVKKMSDKKAMPQMIIDMKDLAAGAYVVRFTCGAQYSTQYIIHAESL